jgi:hypothetical protein
VDRTILNIASLLLGGAGIFAILTDYSVPELSGTYWNGNPFAKKAAVIKASMTWIFTTLAVVGLLIQTVAEIAGEVIPEREHGSTWYAIFFVVGIAVTAAIVWSLARAGRRWAKRRWLPLAIRSQHQLFQNAQSIERNRGWRDDQLAVKDTLMDPETFIRTNMKAATQGVAQIEKLLELTPLTNDDLASRIARLAKFFAERVNSQSTGDSAISS